MAKEIVQLLLSHNLFLTFEFKIADNITSIRGSTISKLKQINQIDYAKVISYDYATSKILLQCNKSGETYSYSAYGNLSYCHCKDCISIRRSQASKKVWTKPGYKEHQSSMQSLVWERPGYKEYQKEIQTQTHSSDMDRQSASIKMKDKFKSKDYRMDNLIKNAKRHRTYPAKDELQFITYLKKMKINYMWQYPMLLKESIGFDVIMDFYLPEYDIFININTDNFHRDFQGVIDKDNKLQKFLGKKLFIVSDLNKSEQLLKEVISQ